MTPENVFKALTEESYQETFKAGFAALNCTATRVRVQTTIRNLLHLYDGKGCASGDVALSQQPVMEAVRERNGTATTVSFIS